MANILDHEALESAAAQVDGIANNFNAELSALGGLVQGTHDFWSDPAQVSFEAKYEQFRTSMTQFIEALNIYTRAMRSHAERNRSETLEASRVFDNI